MTFSTAAWERAASWFAAIMDHGFVRELGAGTLDEKVFLRYIADDAHYLARYSRALATVAARWPDAAGSAVLARFAAGAVEAERQLHVQLLAEESWRAGEPTPTCLAYVNTLQADASLAAAPVALAGLLPCFRVYTEVGQRLAAALDGEEPHPYESWLHMYGNPAFAEDTRRAEALADEQARRHPGLVDDMHEAYERAVRFEWMFWDASWRGESWPSPVLDFIERDSRDGG